jgi:hypothetical protein
VKLNFDSAFTELSGAEIRLESSETHTCVSLMHATGQGSTSIYAKSLSLPWPRRWAQLHRSQSVTNAKKKQKRNRCQLWTT